MKFSISYNFNDQCETCNIQWFRGSKTGVSDDNNWASNLLTYLFGSSNKTGAPGANGSCVIPFEEFSN